MWFILLTSLLALSAAPAAGQRLGGTGTIRGSVSDASGAALPAAAVDIANPVTGYSRHAETAADGSFSITGIAPGSVTVRISRPGFADYQATLAVHSAVPQQLDIHLAVAAQNTTVTVEAAPANILDTRAAASSTVDRRLLDALPALAPDSGLNDAILMTTPGVAADSNGFFHPMGDHAQVSYIIDGQPITDQRNKVFSTSIPANAIQTMDVVSGMPAAEYGDKTSLIVNATTRSGLGQKPSGSLTLSNGSFGEVGEEATLGFGSSHWGNFIAANAQRTGRFLDTPEFLPMHDRGNTFNGFDHMDWQPSGVDAVHLNVMLARNWFQVPNTYDQPHQDQRQKVVSFNVAPGYQHTINGNMLASINAFVRGDAVNYYPSRDPFDDSPVTLAQHRTLTNYGIHGDVAGARGRHNWKAGFSASQTRLNEEFTLALTDPNYNGPGASALESYNLALGGSPYHFQGRANINQAAFFAQDSVTFGALTLNAGLRFDQYNGLTSGGGLQPRSGFAYHFKRTHTVFRGGYSHTIETPTNENLVVSSSTGSGGLASNLFKGQAAQQPIALGSRNQYDAGIQQSLSKWVLVDVSYFRKYTRNAFDFDALFSTPITFPIGWKQSKLDGVSARISTVDLHGFRAYATMGHANARFFGPENGGIIFNSNLNIGAYRQDHDQVYQQNVNLRYAPRGGKLLGWSTDFTWRYDSGLVVGAVNNLNDALALTADQQAAIGLYCGPLSASLTQRIASCNSADYGAARINILAPGTENDDRNPPRTKSRHIFNLSAGTDNLFHGDRLRTTLRFTALNLSNEAALYNFLSPFSGTHWVAPRTYQVQVGWAF